MKISKKHIIKIPDNLSVIYSEYKQLLVIIGENNKKRSITDINLKLIIDNINKSLVVTQTLINTGKKIKNKKSLQGTLISKIKQKIIEMKTTAKKKLKFVGVGYRAECLDVQNNTILKLKVGYSHLIFFKIDKNIKIKCVKSKDLFMLSDSMHDTNQLAARIRSYKKPEPYKGKGILYDNESIKLKEGKKV